MGMENFGIGKRIMRHGAVAAGLTAVAFSPQGAPANPLEVFKAKKAVVEITYDSKIRKAKNIKEKEKLEDEKKIALAKLELEKATAEDADEKEKESRGKADTSESKLKIGEAPKNEAVITVTHREVDLLDENGNVIGSAMEGSKEWRRHREKMAKIQAGVEKEKAKASRPVVVENSPVYYPGGSRRVYSGVSGGFGGGFGRSGGFSRENPHRRRGDFNPGGRQHPDGSVVGRRNSNDGGFNAGRSESRGSNVNRSGNRNNSPVNRSGEGNRRGSSGSRNRR